MSGNVVDLGTVTKLDLDPVRVLDQASKHEFSRVMILGITKDGQEYYAMSCGDASAALWDMERCRYSLMQAADDTIER